MDIRELRDEDVGGVVRLLRDTYPHQLLSEVSFRHRVASSPARAQERRWVAVDGGEIVEQRGFTRTHTRRYSQAARTGIVSVVTENDETNAPMLAVNTRLGYRPFHEVGSYTRDYQ